MKIPMVTAPRRAVLTALNHLGPYAIFLDEATVWRSDHTGKSRRVKEIVTFCVAYMTEYDGESMARFDCYHTLKDLVKLGWVEKRYYDFATQPKRWYHRHGYPGAEYHITTEGKRVLAQPIAPYNDKTHPLYKPMRGIYRELEMNGKLQTLEMARLYFKKYGVQWFTCVEDALTHNKMQYEALRDLVIVRMKKLKVERYRYD